MDQYRKKPVVVHAIQLLSAKAGQPRRLGPTQIPDWFAIAQGRKAITNATDAEGNEIDGLFIHTLEGVMHAAPGDWIIKGVKGELYPCKPDIFEATYTHHQADDATVERVQLAIAQGIYGPKFDPFLNPETFEWCGPIAKAAIAAMREDR